MESDAQMDPTDERTDSWSPPNVHEPAIALNENGKALTKEQSRDDLTSPPRPAGIPSTSSMASMTSGTSAQRLGSGASRVVRQTATEGVVHMHKMPSQLELEKRVAINQKNPLGLDSTTLELVQSGEAGVSKREREGQRGAQV